MRLIEYAEFARGERGFHSAFDVGFKHVIAAHIVTVETANVAYVEPCGKAGFIGHLRNRQNAALFGFVNAEFRLYSVIVNAVGTRELMYHNVNAFKPVDKPFAFAVVI